MRMRKNLVEKERQRSQDEVDEERLEQQRMEVLQEFYSTRVEPKIVIHQN